MTNRNGRPEISVGPPDVRGRRLVELRHGNDLLHADRFDVADAFKRKLFGEAAAAKLPGASRIATADDAATYDPTGAGGPTTAEILADSLLPLAQQADQEQDEGPRIGFPRITAAELASTTYDIEYYIPNVLAVGQPCGLIGPQKSLKTSIALDLAVSLSAAVPFLGYFKVQRAARVAVFSGESGLPVIQETCNRICHAAGKHLADLSIVFSDRLPQFADVLHLDGLKSYLQNDEIEVCIIDPCYLCLDTAGQEGSIFAMGKLLRGITELCQSLGATLVLCHHAKKNTADPYGIPELSNAAWSGFAEYFRQWVLVNRREQYQPGTGDHRLWLTTGGSAGHGGLWGIDVAEGTRDSDGGRYWQVVVHSADDARVAAQEQQERAKAGRLNDRLDADKRSVVRVAARFPAGETPTTIRNTAGLSGQRFNAALAALLQEDCLTACTIEKPNGRTYDAYRLAAEGDQK